MCAEYICTTTKISLQSKNHKKVKFCLKIKKKLNKIPPSNDVKWRPTAMLCYITTKRLLL
jgi:hypothetical protein